MIFGDAAAAVPGGLATDEFVLRPITADDAERDYDAVMETREHLRLWEQSSWPADDFTVAANRDDLIGLEKRHAEHRAFTYTVVDPDGVECLGCVYIFPITAAFLARSEVVAVGEDAWDEVEAFVNFWVRGSRMATGMDARLLAALRTWLHDEWGFERVVFDTSETFTHQVALLERTDMTVKFRLREPGKAADRLSYG